MEIILVQSQYGTVKSNRKNFGAGFDAYLVPESLAAVDDFYQEIKSRDTKPSNILP